MTAIRVNPKPPKIDGILDDEVWQLASIDSGFRHLRSSFSDEGQNIFLVKLNYWLGM